jgi:hypothetical protein
MVTDRKWKSVVAIATLTIIAADPALALTPIPADIAHADKQELAISVSVRPTFRSARYARSGSANTGDRMCFSSNMAAGAFDLIVDGRAKNELEPTTETARFTQSSDSPSCVILPSIRRNSGSEAHFHEIIISPR